MCFRPKRARSSCSAATRCVAKEKKHCPSPNCAVNRSPDDVAKLDGATLFGGSPDKDAGVASINQTPFDLNAYVVSKFGDDSKNKGDDSGVAHDESKHEVCCRLQFGRFVAFVFNLPSKFDAVKVPVPDCIGRVVPRLIVECSGIVTMPKKVIVSDVMTRWVRSWRRDKPHSKTGSMFHQPSTSNRMIRQFFGYMKKHHEWRYNVHSDFNYQGGLSRVITSLYQSRLCADDVSAIF